MTLCKGRITKESLKVIFGDNKHYFYLESKCSTVASNDGLCSKCSKRNTNCNQSSKSFDHGSMDGVIPEKSHIFDGSWYKKAVKSYGEPSQAVLDKAIEAKKTSHDGLDGLVEELAGLKLEPTVKKKRTVRVKKPSNSVIAVDTTGVVTTIPVDSFVESTDEPLEVQDVIHIVLKPFMNQYLRDEERDKVYKNNGGKKGAYVGRWDSEKIVECPDSDEE